MTRGLVIRASCSPGPETHPNLAMADRLPIERKAIAAFIYSCMHEQSTVSTCCRRHAGRWCPARAPISAMHAHHCPPDRHAHPMLSSKCKFSVTQLLALHHAMKQLSEVEFLHCATALQHVATLTLTPRYFCGGLPWTPVHTLHSLTASSLQGGGTCLQAQRLSRSFMLPLSTAQRCAQHPPTTAKVMHDTTRVGLSQ